MFILRIVEEDRKNENDLFQQVIENFELGSAYTVIKKDMTVEFDEIMTSEFPSKNRDEISAVICGLNGDKYFLENDTSLSRRNYFIMTETGRTFEKL